jgi:hypothetical protein
MASIRDRLIRNSRPAVKSEWVDVARSIDLDGLGETIVALRFCRQIEWFRDSESRVDIVIEGNRHAISGTYNDFYGLMTSKDDPLEMAPKLASGRGIGRTSAEAVEVIINIIDHAGVVPPRGVMDGPYYGNFPYVLVPDDWALDDAQFERWLKLTEGDGHADRFLEINRRNFVKDMIKPVDLIIWSSRNTAAENAAALTQLDAFR